MASVDGYKTCDFDDHVTKAQLQERLSTALTDVHHAWANERREWESRFKALEARACKHFISFNIQQPCDACDQPFSAHPSESDAEVSAI